MNVTRRAFLSATTLAAASAPAPPQVSTQGPTAAVPVTHSRTRPTGELGRRIEMTALRLTRGGLPEFTPDFVLADVTLDRRRRFVNYSGDLSGRWIGALAMLPPAGSEAALDSVVQSLLQHQKPDGRFGDATLAFTADAIGGEHMALLWGNGRLLVGLLEYHANRRQEAVLRAARRLGDFLAGVRKQCALPEVMKRVEGQGASGYICFTQLVEPLVMLAEATDEHSYLESARSIVPLLQPRGIQHSHGYLTTLRGMVMLHEASRDAGVLSTAEAAFDDLVGSPDYAVYGGPPEYFGWENQSIADAQRNQIIAASGREIRSEGCSEADFLRLALQLWRATGRAEYLDLAERCLLNSFYLNQFNTGDFGHHVMFRHGLKPTESIGRAWWCCTMHCYRAFRDVLDSIVTTEGGARRLHLYLDSSWSDGTLGLTVRREPSGASVVIDRAPAAPAELSLRLPPWSVRATVRVNGGEASGETAGGYFTIRRAWRKGDRIDVRFDYRVRFRTREGRDLAPGDLGASPVESAMFYGPWLMGADEEWEPLFFGEPWQDNVVSVPAVIRPEPASRRAVPTGAAIFSIPAAHLTMSYAHGGFVQRAALRLRPISEQTPLGQRTVAVWVLYGSDV